MSAAPSLAYAVVVPCVAVTGLGEVLTEGGQRFKHFRHGGDVAGPVVLLQIDVDRIVAPPGCPEFVVPQSLQFGGSSGGTRAGDEHVAAVLEIERLEVFVPCAALSVGPYHAVGGLSGVGLRAVEAESQPLIDRLIVSEMACAQAVVGVVDQMPGVVHGVGEIGCALLDGMAVVAVEARLVDEV